MLCIRSPPNSRNDDRALGILRECFSGKQVVGVDARKLVLEGGAIHCITQQQPGPVSYTHLVFAGAEGACRGVGGVVPEGKILVAVVPHGAVVAGEDHQGVLFQSGFL